MKCVADRDYNVIRDWSEHQHWWNRDNQNPAGDIRSLRCAYCDFEIRKAQVRRRRATGLANYNRMRAIVVAHLHANHREELAKHQEEV